MRWQWFGKDEIDCSDQGVYTYKGDSLNHISSQNLPLGSQASAGTPVDMGTWGLVHTKFWQPP